MSVPGVARAAGATLVSGKHGETVSVGHAEAAMAGLANLPGHQARKTKRHGKRLPDSF